jgi:hypothetical protein
MDRASRSLDALQCPDTTYDFFPDQPRYAYADRSLGL